MKECQSEDKTTKKNNPWHARRKRKIINYDDYYGDLNDEHVHTWTLDDEHDNNLYEQDQHDNELYEQDERYYS